ncbi:MAG: tRNA (guanosine(37)-N1)-methyltransferase TrmD [Dehalococcoidia bacterium]|nr:tRNA (guanosine(37)-N1)-methyltransferase TrmD [Dehalococcoidia bacterium]
MYIHILTLFPNMFTGPFSESIIKRAIDRGLVEIAIHNIRDYTADRHHVVDDSPYGGGPGMVLKPEPLFEAVAAIKSEWSKCGESEKGESELPVLLLTPQGRLFDQRAAEELAEYDELILICGHYEGVDERVREHLVTDEISIGDYILSGGELAAMVVVDAMVRQLPGALGSGESVGEDSHSSGLLEYPQYTRPQSFRGWEVPEVLLSGNHAAIARWRREQSLRRTIRRRPDLLERAALSDEERRLVAQMEREED